MPAIPFLDSHSICVELLVQVVQKRNSLDDHGINLVGRELQLVSGQAVRQTERHGVDVFGHQAWDERWEVFADGTVDVGGARVGHGCDLQTRQFSDGVRELWISNSKRDLLLVLDLVEHASERGCDLANQYKSLEE